VDEYTHAYEHTCVWSWTGPPWGSRALRLMHMTRGLSVVSLSFLIFVIYQILKLVQCLGVSSSPTTCRLRFFGHIMRNILPSVLWCCWLGSRKGIQPVKNWVGRYLRGYLSGLRCKWFAYGPADATATSSSLAAVKSGMIYLSAASLPRLSLKKGR